MFARPHLHKADRSRTAKDSNMEHLGKERAEMLQNQPNFGKILCDPDAAQISRHGTFTILCVARCGDLRP